MLKTLQNFYKATTSRAWAIGTGNRYVSSLPTPTSGYLVINPSNTTKREIIEYSGTGTDGNGNYVTVITRGVGDTTDQTHSIGEPVRMNMTAEYYSDIQVETDDLQDQIDTLVLQNAPNASTTVKGISKLSAAPLSATEPIVVGTEDTKYKKIDDIPDNFVDTSAGASDSGKGVKLNASGVLDQTFSPIGFGDGSDGDVTISSPTTLTRDMYYDNLTVNDTLTTDGYRIFVKGTLTGTGTIQYPTANSGSNGSGGGAGGTVNSGGPLINQAGGDGGIGNAPGSAGAVGYIGSSGGDGGDEINNFSNEQGGAGGTNVSVQKYGIEKWSTLSLSEMTTSGLIQRKVSSGGGGAGDNTGDNNGGGGGASGGVILIVARNWAGTFTLQAIGGDGGDGGGGDTGGGGGGAGGSSVVVYLEKTWTGSYALTGGTGGNPRGSNGSAGTSYEIPITQLL